MILIEYFNGKKWIPTGGQFSNESVAWISLGKDCLNYRTKDKETGKVLHENLDKEKNEN